VSQPAATVQERPENITVTGRRPTDDEARTAVSQFVTAHSTLTVIKQLARWQTAVCPNVYNMPKAFGDFVIARIKALARAVRAPVREACDPNVRIFYTSRPQAVLDWVAEHKPDVLGFHFNSERKDLATVHRPIQAWYVTATNGMVDDAYTSRPPGVPGSRLSNGYRSDLVHVLIVMNSGALAGRPVGPVADYIAMLALAQVQAPDDCVRLPSILNYLASSCPGENRPAAITAADKAYLEGLYAMSPEAFGRLQRAQIINHMQRSDADAAPETMSTQ
jgi:hypothetical protein